MKKIRYRIGPVNEKKIHKGIGQRITVALGNVSGIFKLQNNIVNKYESRMERETVIDSEVLVLFLYLYYKRVNIGLD